MKATWIAILILVLIIIFCSGYIYHLKSGLEVKYDTIRTEIKLQPIYISDTVIRTNEKRTIKETVVIPGEIDTALVYKLLSERDSLNKELAKLNVQNNLEVDTILPPDNDTLLVRYDFLNPRIEIDFKPAVRTVDVPVSYECPKSHEVTYGLGGAVLGIIIGVLIQ